MTKKQIEQLYKQIETLKELAYKDELTRLYNRRGFAEEAEKFIKEVVAFKKDPERRKNFLIKNFGIALFDIDNFKKLNDTYGHQTGDEALKLVSKVILKAVRSVDLVARWGGEEIVLGLVGANESDAFEIANNIREKLSQTPLQAGKKEIYFTVSGGVASFEQAGDFDAIFHLADKALYKAKKEGKNQIVKSTQLKLKARSAK